jgi:transketolase
VTPDSATVAARARALVLEASAYAQTCHIGSSLSIIDILAVLYADVIPAGEEETRFLLSKGHAASALYAALAAVGTLDPDEVRHGYCADGGRFHGHPKRGVPGVEMTAGSLGHGPGIAVGVALAQREARTGTTVCLVGDGECNEGSVWEAVAIAGQIGLTNLTIVVDANGLQGLGRCHEIALQAPLAPRFAAFGWDVVTIDGHDHDALRYEFGAAPLGRPRAIVAETVKGYGVPWYEDELMSHYRPLALEDLPRALAALEVR